MWSQFCRRAISKTKPAPVVDSRPRLSNPSELDSCPWPSPGLPGKHRLVEPSSAADSFRLVECWASPPGLNLLSLLSGRRARLARRSTDFIQTIDSEIDSGHRNATKEKNKKSLH